MCTHVQRYQRLPARAWAARPAAGKIRAMSLITRANTADLTPPRHRAARLTLLTLLLWATGVSAAVAAAAPPVALIPVPGKAGAAITTQAATRVATEAATRAAPAARTAVGSKSKPATRRQQLKREAEGLALATATVEIITEAQLNVAMRVLTGQADCEFNEHVTVSPMDGQPGHFQVGHKGQRYTMVPEDTATGAVRLVDRRAEVIWLQIPIKSMLMNSKQGRRMVDACTHSEQRAAVVAFAEAGAGLGIAAIAAAAPVAAATPVVAATLVAAATPVTNSTPAVPASQASPASPASPAQAEALTAQATPCGPGNAAAEEAAAPASAPR